MDEIGWDVKHRQTGVAGFMTQQHQGFLDTAFLQLSFAIKVWHYLASHENSPVQYPFNKDTFDLDLIASNEISQVSCPNNQWDTFQEILFASENNVSICFGTAAITLWEAIRKKKDISTSAFPQLRTDEEKLAGLSYIIRCCFAHDMLMPQWIMKPKYKIIYQLGNKLVDLQSLDGEKFKDSDVGGYDALRHIRAEAEFKGLL